jgi:hypothetical protein
MKNVTPETTDSLLYKMSILFSEILEISNCVKFHPGLQTLKFKWGQKQ